MTIFRHDIFVFALALILAPSAWGQTYSLGTSNCVEGPARGTDSVVLAVSLLTAPWTAMTNVSWLHLSAANQSGTGSTNVVFSFDANLGATRTGTLTISGQTLTVTQAGATYVAANPMTTLTTYPSSMFGVPSFVAVDESGNVYIATDATIDKWTAASNSLTTLVASGLSVPEGVAVDGSGNVYFADIGDWTIKEWVAASNTVTTLVGMGLNVPLGVAVDGPGNVYIADNGNNAIKEWTVASNTVTTLVGMGLNDIQGVAVDGAGNVYIADCGTNAIEKWTAANNTVTTLVGMGLNVPLGVAVDGSGNVYIADCLNNAIKEWTAANNTVTTLVSMGLNDPQGVAVDSAGNVYIADTLNSAVEELPRAFVDPTSKMEPLTAGSDVLPMVLPSTENLNGLFAPTSDSTWLNIQGVTNGVVSFAFTAGTVNRTAQITVLGQTIYITQGGPSYSLGTSNSVEGPAMGTDSVVLAVSPPPTTWTATTNASWLHLSMANQSGSGSTNLVFSFDANSGATRTGTLTISGQTLTVTQAGATYVVANPLTPLVSGLNEPYGVTVDDACNVYIADSRNNAIEKWAVANGKVTTLLTSGLLNPQGVAVDSSGNVYIADTYHQAAKKWTAATSNVTTLVSSVVDSPISVAVDGAGNMFIADYDNFNASSTIRKWTAANSNVTTLVSESQSLLTGVTVDGAGNVYIADNNNNAIKKWTAANGTVSSLVSSGLSYPQGVTVDGAGNVFIADGDNTIKKWTAANGTVSTLVAGLNYPNGLSVDKAGNVYIGDTFNNAIEKLSRAFVDPTARLETTGDGSDLLPVVLPPTENLTGPFIPLSDSSWLTITGVNNGVVSFAFTANKVAVSRTAHITVMGQAIAVTQNALPVTPPILTGMQFAVNGVFSFGFSNNQNASFTIWTTTNVALPLADWMVAGTPTNNGSGLYQFATPASTNDVQQFYRVTSP
jgi:DNA-binding beta-propeller fold protein YncE